MEDMTRLELLAVLYSLQALLNDERVEQAREIIEKIIKEAEKSLPNKIFSRQATNKMGNLLSPSYKIV